MENGSKIKINYIAGSFLPQGVEARVDGQKLVFSPLSAVDRALGATDVVVEFKDIRDFEFKGDLSKSLHITTHDKVHKFVGNHARKLAALLEEALLDDRLEKTGNEEITREVERSGVNESEVKEQCSNCDQPVRPDFVYCPKCQFRIRPYCEECRHAVEIAWKACAFCGQRLSKG